MWSFLVFEDGNYPTASHKIDDRILPVVELASPCYELIPSFQFIFLLIFRRKCKVIDPCFITPSQYAFSEMPTISGSSRIFSRQSPNTILWNFFTISGVITSFGWPNKGAESCTVNSSLALILVRLRPFRLEFYHINMVSFFHVY